MAKKRKVIEKDDKGKTVAKVCPKRGICAKCRRLGLAVCLTCIEYQQLIRNDIQLPELFQTDTSGTEN